MSVTGGIVGNLVEAMGDDALPSVGAVGVVGMEGAENIMGRLALRALGRAVSAASVGSASAAMSMRSNWDFMAWSQPHTSNSLPSMTWRSGARSRAISRIFLGAMKWRSPLANAMSCSGLKTFIGFMVRR